MMQMKRGLVNLRAVMFLLCLSALGMGIGRAAPAAGTNSVLILGSTAKNAISSIEAYEATKAGFTVVVASDADWATMTTADFASYREIIFADGMCSGIGTLNAAIANQDVWGPAVTGNVIVMGDHPGSSALFTTTAKDFIQNALLFAGAAEGTGAYITLGCYMSSSIPTDVSILKAFGQFSAVQLNGCSDSAHLVAADPNLDSLNDADMSGWKCTSDAGFVNWANSFTPLVVATNVPGQFVDASTGANVSPYMLVRGAQVTSLTTLQAAPAASQAAPTASLKLIAASVPVPGDPTVNLSMPMSGTHDFFNQPIDLTTSDGNWGLKGDVRAYLSWNPNSNIAVQYNSSLMQQGESPGTVDTLNPGHGNLCAGFEASLDAVIDGDSLGLGGVSQSVCGDCPLNVDGSPHSCSLGEQYLELYCGGIGVVDACVYLTVTPTTTVTPEAFSTDRTVYYDGTPKTGPSVVSFPPNQYDDPIHLSCVEPVGTDVVYELAKPRTSAPFSNFGIDLGVAGGLEECLPVLGCDKQIIIDEAHLLSIPLPLSGLTLDLTGPTGQVDLGQVQKENTPPDLTNVATSYSGNEGSPIQVSAAGAKDNCLDYSSLVWNFSDGGVAYGFSPFHTFQDADVFSGQLAVTNVGGIQSTKAFTATVKNVPPVVAAGPDTTAPWGVPVAFNGSATAPGANDQATLVYTWSFGDGTPSATGGSSVRHAYSVPGTYTSTLKVCDEDNFCSSATRNVMVRKRNVSLGYLGDQQGVYDTLTNLSGALVDELGSTVPGRTMVFAINAEAGGAAATNSAGLASTTHLLGLSAGPYLASASFAGDSLYNAPAASVAAYTVSQKATQVTYTGALTGGPNKTISLSAVLVDSQNKPLAGRLIAFRLGAQSASATTNASGVATTTLMLNQKNASYPLTSTFIPASADTGRYLGSVASATFKLQAK